MNRLLYSLGIISAALSFTSCNTNPKGIETGLDQNDSTGSEGTDTLSKNDVKLSSCYLATIGRDSAFLHIASAKGKVEGTLHYLPEERQEQMGDIIGTISHDTIMVDYHAKGFPTRELTFLVREEQIIEGLGDQILDKGEIVYKNKVNIDYTGKSYIFLPSECEQEQGKTERKEGSHL